MKTLIATTIIALASGSAGAFSLSDYDQQEFYSGQETNFNVTVNPGIKMIREDLYKTAFPKVTPGLENQRGIADVDIPTELYEEGHWPS